jgi:polysaccharide pyruvyl transferase WcaK-like protein
MRVYLAGQTNFGNRGCEALVRSTVDMVRASFPDAEILVPATDPAADAAQWPEAAHHGVRFVAAGLPGSGFLNWSRVVSRIPALARLPWPRLPDGDFVRRDLRGSDLLLSIGGDNLSLDYGLDSLAYFVAVAAAAREMGSPVVLWGASVGPFSRLPAVERAMRLHLRRLDVITVRETVSLAYLRALGVGPHVSLVPDSAFLLRPQPCDTATFWPDAPGGVLGVNLSPLVEQVRQRAGAATSLLDEAAAWLRALLQRRPDLGVLLVPHVAPLNGHARNNDESYIRMLAAAVGPAPQLACAPSRLNAAETKHVISRCRWFVGARTHATIAAISCMVPTLSIGYSVKAQGINRDLFGHERHVLDARTLDCAQLGAAFDRLCRDESAVRDQLAERVPAWRLRAQAGGAAALRQATGADGVRSATAGATGAVTPKGG